MGTISSFEFDPGKFKSYDPKKKENELGELDKQINEVAKTFGPPPPTEVSEAEIKMLTREIYVHPEKVSSESDSTVTTSKINQLFQRTVHGDKEIQGKSEEGQKHLMLSLFHLNTVPDTPDEPLSLPTIINKKIYHK